MRQYVNPELEKLLLSKGCIPDGKNFDLLDCIRRENAIKIWGEKEVCSMCGDSKHLIKRYGQWECQACDVGTTDQWQYNSQQILDLYQSGGDWQGYLINHLKGENNV